MGHNEYSRAEPWAIAAVRVTAAIESVVGRATREEDSFGSYRNELKKSSYCYITKILTNLSRDINEYIKPEGEIS